MNWRLNVGKYRELVSLTELNCVGGADLSTIIQAKCPKCKKDLRIPSDWLQQAIRCKHCNSVIQAKSGGATPPAAPARASGARKAARPAKARAAKPAQVQATKPAPARPAPASAPVAQAPVKPIPISPPVAQAVAPTPVVAPPGGFSDVQSEGGIYTPTSPLGRRRAGNPTVFWIKTGITLAILITAGVCFRIYAWDFIKQRIDEESGNAPRTAKNNEDGTDNVGGGKSSGGDGVGSGRRRPGRPNIQGIPKGSKIFPRRALVVSVHNYLFANPTHFGSFSKHSTRNIRSLLGRLSRRESFRIAPMQITHLSDLAKEPHSPIKPVIMDTMRAFFETSRSQDCIVMMFIGHGVVVDEKPYLVPIEGELEEAETLIPLEWVYKELAKCKARQKIFILDTCRYNPDRGSERPGGDPMETEFAEALKKPPEGVQLWTSCGEDERSYEFDFDPVNNGLFIDALHRAASEGVQGRIQKPTDPIPLDDLVKLVNTEMRELLDSLGLKQVSKLYGKMKPGEAKFDPNLPLPPKPPISKPPGLEGGEADPQTVRQILAEISVPPIKPTDQEGLLKYEAMPPMPAKALQGYPIDNAPNKLKEEIRRAQALLWAVSPMTPPREMMPLVDKVRLDGGLSSNLSVMKGFYRAPAEANVDNFKGQVLKDQEQLTTIIRLLTEEFEILEEMAEERDNLSKRWQANYDFMLARIRAQLAYVWEHQSMLGQMRKEFPERDPAVHSGWRLSSREKPKGDSEGKRHARKARNLLEDLAEEHPKTPWALLAKREGLTALGLEWQATKGGY